MKRRILTFLIPLLSCCGAAHARDAFAAVQCGADIPHVLTGKSLPDGADGVIEGRHAAIGLKDMGGEDISDTLFESSWRICGNEYVMLVGKNQIVRDVLALPAHSRRSPEFSDDYCELNGKKTADLVIAILDNPAASDAADAPRIPPGDSSLLPAKFAWSIDQKHAKFVPMDVKGLGCPKSGIITLDGGA